MGVINLQHHLGFLSEIVFYFRPLPAKKRWRKKNTHKYRLIYPPFCEKVHPQSMTAASVLLADCSLQEKHTMSDIKFSCPHCQQRLCVPDSALGRTLACPGCQGHIRLPERNHVPAELHAPPAPEADKLYTVSAMTQQGTDIKFACPNCSVHIVIVERAAGKQISCQRCAAKILVPGTPRSASAPPAPVAPAVPAAASPSAAVPSEPAQLTAAQLLEKIRDGDQQAGRALLATGLPAVTELLGCFYESALDQADTNKGIEHIINLLVKCGGVCVQPLISKLGKSRHAYVALAKVGTEEAISALVRELSSVNWRRAEMACKALSLMDSPKALKLVSQLETVRKTTRVGEVFSAAGSAIMAIQTRFRKTA